MILSVTIKNQEESHSRKTVENVYIFPVFFVQMVSKTRRKTKNLRGEIGAALVGGLGFMVNACAPKLVQTEIISKRWVEARPAVVRVAEKSTDDDFKRDLSFDYVLEDYARRKLNVHISERGTRFLSETQHLETTRFLSKEEMVKETWSEFDFDACDKSGKGMLPPVLGLGLLSGLVVGGLADDRGTGSMAGVSVALGAMVVHGIVFCSTKAKKFRTTQKTVRDAAIRPEISFSEQKGTAVPLYFPQKPLASGKLFVEGLESRLQPVSVRDGLAEIPVQMEYPAIFAVDKESAVSRIIKGVKPFCREDIKAYLLSHLRPASRQVRLTVNAPKKGEITESETQEHTLNYLLGSPLEEVLQFAADNILSRKLRDVRVVFKDGKYDVRIPSLHVTYVPHNVPDREEFAEECIEDGDVLEEFIQDYLHTTISRELRGSHTMKVYTPSTVEVTAVHPLYRTRKSTLRFTPSTTVEEVSLQIDLSWVASSCRDGLHEYVVTEFQKGKTPSRADIIRKAVEISINPSIQEVTLVYKDSESHALLRRVSIEASPINVPSPRVLAGRCFEGDDVPVALRAMRDYHHAPFSQQPVMDTKNDFTIYVPSSFRIKAVHSDYHYDESIVQFRGGVETRYLQELGSKHRVILEH